MARPTIAAIQQEVAKAYGLPRRVMVDRSLHRSHAHPRQEAMALAVRLTNHSKSRVGDFFGDRDPTTVGHALRVVRKRLEADRELRIRLCGVVRRVLR